MTTTVTELPCLSYGVHSTTANNLILFNDSVDHAISVGSGDDIIFGGGGNDVIMGGAGNNRLYGGKGFDVITGGEGDDKIEGGQGNDLLNGGGGKNEFVFAAYAKSGSGFDGDDTITDFKVADVLTIVGGYKVEDLFASPKLMQDATEGGVAGVKLFYANNGASIFLQNFSKAQLKPANFHVLESTLQ